MEGEQESQINMRQRRKKEDFFFTKGILFKQKCKYQTKFKKLSLKTSYFQNNANLNRMTSVDLISL